MHARTGFLGGLCCFLRRGLICTSLVITIAFAPPCSLYWQLVPQGTEVPIGGDLRVRLQSGRGLPQLERAMHVYAKVLLCSDSCTAGTAASRI